MTGADLPPLVILPGALGALESGESFTDILGKRRQLIPIGYSADDNLDKLLRRIASAGPAANGGQVDLLGQSFGGWIAQCFAGRYPAQVRRLVLSHSFMLSPRDAWRFRLGLRLLGVLPSELFGWLLAKRIAVALNPIKRLDRALFEQLSDRLAAPLDDQALRPVLMAQQRVLAESCDSRRPRADLPTLIIESDQDPIIRDKAQAKLRARYPRAEVHRFVGTGHVSALASPREFALAVGGFLDRP